MHCNALHFGNKLTGVIQVKALNSSVGKKSTEVNNW